MRNCCGEFLSEGLVGFVTDHVMRIGGHLPELRFCPCRLPTPVRMRRTSWPPYVRRCRGMQASIGDGARLRSAWLRALRALRRRRRSGASPASSATSRRRFTVVIGLAEILAAFGVSDDDVFATGADQHRAGNRSPVNAPSFSQNISCAPTCTFEPFAASTTFGDVHERRADHDLVAVMTFHKRQKCLP